MVGNTTLGLFSFHPIAWQIKILPNLHVLRWQWHHHVLNANADKTTTSADSIQASISEKPFLSTPRQAQERCLVLQTLCVVWYKETVALMAACWAEHHRAARLRMRDNILWLTCHAHSLLLPQLGALNMGARNGSSRDSDLAN